MKLFKKVIGWVIIILFVAFLLFGVYLIISNEGLLYFSIVIGGSVIVGCIFILGLELLKD